MSTSLFIIGGILVISFSITIIFLTATLFRFINRNKIKELAKAEDQTDSVSKDLS